MKLIIDMNLSPNWVQILKESGIDATHWSEIGAQDARGLVMKKPAQWRVCVGRSAVAIGYLLPSTQPPSGCRWK